MANHDDRPDPEDPQDAAPPDRKAELTFEDLRVSVVEGEDRRLRLESFVGDSRKAADEGDAAPLVAHVFPESTKDAAAAPDASEGPHRFSGEFGALAPKPAEAETIGRALHEALREAVPVAYGATVFRASLPKRRGARIVLDFTGAPRLARLPWELLHDGERFLALRRDTPIIRTLDLEEADPIDLGGGSLRLLVATSSAAPAGLPPVDADLELARITKEVNEATSPIELHHVRANKDLLEEALEKVKPHVFHYIGHGASASAGAEDRLLFEGAEPGSSQIVHGGDIAPILAEHGDFLGVVFLNSCLGATSDTAHAFGGTAQKIVRAGIPAVVAMQFLIPDGAAAKLAARFYDALAEGKPIDEALTAARLSLKLNASANWATPVLYWRVPDGVVFTNPARAAEADVAVDHAAPNEVAADAADADAPPRPAARRPRLAVAAVVAATVALASVSYLLLRPSIGARMPLPHAVIRPTGVEPPAPMARPPVPPPPPAPMARPPGPSTRLAPTARPPDFAPPPDADMGPPASTRPLVADASAPIVNARTFDRGSAELSPLRPDVAADVADFLARHPDFVVRFTGMADAEGSAAWNARLATSRAQGWADEVRAAGVSDDRIVIESLGEAWASGLRSRDRSTAITFALRADDAAAFAADADLPPDWLAGVTLPTADELRRSGLRVRVDVHADASGSREASALASRSWGERARARILARGTPADLVEVLPWGEDRPLSKIQPGATAADDRRIEISLVPLEPGTIPFGFGESSLGLDHAQVAIEEIADALAASTDVVVTLTGMGDVGAPDGEEAEARANAVRDALIAQGVPERRVEMQAPRPAMALRLREALGGQGVEVALRPAVARAVRFDFDGHELSAEARVELAELATWMEADRHASLVVEGHCDTRGSGDYNLGLGRLRVESVIAFLAESGVDEARLDAISFGSTRPPLPDARTDDEHAVNRCVTFRIAGLAWGG